MHIINFGVQGHQLWGEFGGIVGSLSKYSTIGCLFKYRHAQVDVLQLTVDLVCCAPHYPGILVCYLTEFFVRMCTSWVRIHTSSHYLYVCLTVSTAKSPMKHKINKVNRKYYQSMCFVCNQYMGIPGTSIQSCF